MATKFYIDARPGKSGESLVRCSISFHGRRFLTTTGITINPGAWNGNTQRAMNTFKGRPTVNRKGMTARDINARLKAIDTYFAEMECSTDKTASIDLKAIYTQKFGRNDSQAATKPKTFYDIFDEFTATMGAQNDWTAATHEKFSALRHDLLEFRGERMKFADMSNEGLASFVDFLRVKHDLKNSTIGKKFGFLKWFLKWAEIKGYNTTADYKTFNPKLKKADNGVVFLSWDELMTLYNFEFPKAGEVLRLTDPSGEQYEKRVSLEPSTMERVRDVFCFCCFTSLRYSDVANLKQHDVSGDCITLTTIKTSDTIRIELNKYSRAILEKYKKARLPLGKALPVISNQRMNEYLKEIAEICGFNAPITRTFYKGNKRIDEVRPKWSLIGTHTARRTFICNALTMGIPPQIVMKWTGHSDYKSMKPYIDIADQAKAEAMRKFDAI